MKLKHSHSSRKRCSALTIIEVVIALALSALTFGGIVSGHIFAARKAEWSAYSLAAQSLAMQRMEQARSAKWDLLASPPVNQLIQANFPPINNDVLDIPISGSNIVYASTTTTISSVSTNVPLVLIRVECVWPFMDRGFFTNSIQTYRSPDQQ